MGRAEVGTPKYLANKMKAKGLQKLRWYCQMCEKQCRDENGFKCHTTSESHQRQLLLFADNSGKYIYSFSKEFSDGYMEVLRRRFGTKRVSCNKVYQEYIADKNHLHMNATRWLTLTDYVKWLGRTGQCIVDETEKGWFVTYIDRSPEAIEAQEKIKKKEKMDKDDEERMLEFIGKQIEKSKKDEPEMVYTEFKRDDEEKPLKLDIKLSSRVTTKPATKRSSDQNDESDEFVFKKPKPLTSRSYASSSSSSSKSEKKSALDEIMQMEETSKEKKNRKDYWLAEGIVVKFMSKAFDGKYYKQKAVVLDVSDKYCGKIKFLDSGVKIKADQEHLETVIPAIGKPVQVLNGAYRGCMAILRELIENKFCVKIEIAKGPLKGRIVNNVDYGDISKISDE